MCILTGYQPLFGKWARTHPPKERLVSCDFLCWFKPIMLLPAEFRLAKIVAEIITTKQKVLPWSIACRSDYDGAETLGEILEFWRYTTFCSIVCCAFSFDDCGWRDLHLQGSLQGALGLDNCVHYRCNRPRLYLTEEHSIRWKFCLVNQKLFRLIGDRFQIQWYRSRQNYQFSNFVTVVNGSRVQPSLFGEDQRPDPGDGGNRAYLDGRQHISMTYSQMYVHFDWLPAPPSGWLLMFCGAF